MTRKKPVTKKSAASKKPQTAKKSKASTKSGAKKPAAKKPAAKPTKPRKPAAQTSAAQAKTASSRNVIAKFPADPGGRVTRRPPNNPAMPIEFVEDMQLAFTSWKDDLEDFSAHLRSLDRKRLNGVGVRKLGFIGRALQLAAENPEFLPHWLPLKKFQDDNNLFLALRTSFDTIRQIHEILWNIVLEASDILYTDALEYYAQVGDAAKRRIDPAETIHADLFEYFKRGPRTEDEPTIKESKRDINGLIRGDREGKAVIINEKPHLVGGKHEIIDETYKDSARFKEDYKGDIED